MYKNKCLFCKNIFDNKLKNKMYCSLQCTKKMWYNKRKSNSLHNNPDGFYKTETGRGYKWEKYVADLLKAKHLEFNGRNEVTFRADIEWNGKFIDVKSSLLNKRKNKRGVPVVKEQMGFWNFKPSYIKDNIDYVFCVCVNEIDIPVKLLLIPSKEYPKMGLTIGHTSKYDKYIYIP